MTDALTYEELEYRVRILENEARWRRQAEQALQESEKRFKLLFEYAPDMFIICDENGVLIDANRAAERLTGYERHEVVGKSLLSIGILPKSHTQKAAELLYKISRKIPTEPENAPLHLPDLLNEKAEGSNTILCSFKTKRNGLKGGKILFRRFEADHQNLIVGRIIVTVNAAR